MNRKSMIVWAAVLAWAGPVALSLAQDPKDAKAEAYKMWDIDSMIHQAADNVSRRYNLNPQQAEYTKKMMIERVTRFLEENQDQIWPLVRDLARYQLTGTPPDENTAKRIGDGALPLIEKARKAILDGNNEWRSILSEDQKRLHDYDLNEMNGTFHKVTQNFEEWKTGKPVQNPLFPPYVPKDDEPATPRQPAQRYTSQERKRSNQEGAWAKYVGDFIRKYDLDPGQREAAQSILRELKDRAAKHRDSHSNEYAEVDQRLKEAFGSGDLKKRAAVERDETALNKPISDMFDELRQRLDKIPTDAQKEKYNESVKSKRPVRPAPRREAASQPVLPIVPATQPEATHELKAKEPPAPSRP